MSGSLIENPVIAGNDAGTRDAFNFITRPESAPRVGFFTRNNEPLFPPVSSKYTADLILHYLKRQYGMSERTVENLDFKIYYSDLRDHPDFSPEALWLTIWRAGPDA